MDIQIINGGVILIGDLKTDNMHPASPEELVTYATQIAAYKTQFYSHRKTPKWAILQADMDAYPAVKATLTTSISAVTDAKTKQALNDAKALIQQLQQEITDLKHVVGQGQQIEP